MTRTCRRLAIGVLLIHGCLLSALAADAVASRYAGRPLAEVLSELRGPGLDLIYSSDLVAEFMRVAAEPRSTNRLLIAREILEPHGLALVVVRPGLYAVTLGSGSPGKRIARGRLLDASTGAPVVGGRVSLQPFEATDWSDREGRFAIGPVPDGTYMLQAEAQGYLATGISAFTVSETATEAEIWLSPSRTQLGEVVVSTSRYAIDPSGPVGSIHVGGDALAVQPSLGEDAIRALGRFPGMAQNGLSAQSSIRGGEAGEVLTLLDGFPLRQAFHMPAYHSVFGMIDPSLIGGAEIYTGGFPVRYGNRMAGVFDLQTIDGRAAPRTALGVSVFNALARGAGDLPSAGMDWLAAVRVGTLKPFLQAFADDAGHPSYADVYARAGYGEPDRIRLSANILWSRDELSIARRSQGETAQIESRNRYVWVRADREWGEGLGASLWLGHSSIDGYRAGSTDNPSISSGTVSDRRSSDYWEVRGRIAWQPGHEHWFEGGFEGTEEDAVYRYEALAAFSEPVAALFERGPALVRSLDLEPNRERVALFAAHRWRPTAKFTSEAGLRAQRTITAGRTAKEWILDPRVSLRWQVLPATDLRAHWGRFHQTDEVHELKVEDGLTVFPEAQRVDQLIIGLDHRLPDSKALRLEYFRKLQSEPRPRFENLLDPMSLIPEIAPDRVDIAPVAAEMRGAEFTVSSAETDTNWWAGIAWSEAWDSVGGRSVDRSWDQTWSASGGIDWIRGDWRFGAVAGAHRGWPTTQVLATELGPRNAIRFPDRYTLDLRAEYRRPLRIGSLAVTLEIINAVNVGDACCKQLTVADDGNGAPAFSTTRSGWVSVVP